MPSKNKAIETEPGSGFPSVCLEVESEQDDEIKLHFSVTDTDIGILVRQLDRVFETFTLADASIARRYGGTGLGPPISSRLIHIMGGASGLKARKEKARLSTSSYRWKRPASRRVFRFIHKFFHSDCGILHAA